MNLFKCFVAFLAISLTCFPYELKAQEYHCDVNDDGSVNVVDAVIVVDHILGNHKHVNPVEAIDLGLPSGLKWANCNIGANKPEEMGNYFAWGEIYEKDNYELSSYFLCNGSFDSCFNMKGKNISGTQFDVAHVKLGDDWRMPTFDEFKELIDNCTYRWTTYKGVKGAKFFGPNGNSIFLPAAGYSYGTNVAVKGENGFYWSGTQYSTYVYMGYSLDFGSGYVVWGDYYRSLGFPIRPVRN